MVEDALMLLEQAKKSGQGPWQELAIVVLLLSQGICHERLKIVKEGLSLTLARSKD